MSIFRTSLFACALALTSVACGDEKTEPPVDPVVTDDVTLEVPEANVGFQFTIPAFDIPVGAELQDCHFFEVPENPDRPGEARFISRFHARQNPGTHHMNVFRVKTRHDLYGAPGDIVKGDIPDSPCWKSSNWADWPIVVNSQESSVSGEINWTLPEGVAQRFEPGELLMLQTHYVNATTQVSDVGRGKVFVNFHEVEADKVVHEMGTMFTTNQNIRVCPGERREYEKTCNFAREEPIHIIGANGHFHSRGVRFTAYSYDAATDPDAAVIERILAAVGPVGAGISLEYYFSSVDNERFGCGTKLPHNVTGLLGVMNGHQSDLRTGLPLQMVEIHEPMRLLLIVEATPETLLRVASRQPEVAELVVNAWVQLVSLDPDTGAMAEFRQGGFVPYVPEPVLLPVVERSPEWHMRARVHLQPALVRSALPEIAVGHGHHPEPMTEGAA